MRILLAQINPIIGDLEYNTQKILGAIEDAKKQGVDLILFPEMCITGYPPEDFLLLHDFIDTVHEKLDEIVAASKEITVIVGLPRRHEDKREKHLCNSAAVIHNQKLLGFQDKALLPTYDIFDERRYFDSSQQIKIWDIEGKTLAVTVCEDIWQHSELVKFASYKYDPILAFKEVKPDLLLNLSASPYSRTKLQKRLAAGSNAAVTLDCPVVLCNQVGGNDSLIFDGYSFYVGADGVLRQMAKGFEEDGLVIDLEKEMSPLSFEQDHHQDIYRALVLGLEDYFRKSGFSQALIGLSGGIDSALVACIAVDALGKENVLTLNMPSRYSSQEGINDAKQLAKNLGIERWDIPIEKPFQSYLDLLGPHFANLPTDATEENLQARTRGMILMAISNKFGKVVLSTGNKSELAMGYATLYGDMCGGLGVISDLTKREVYSLSKWINRKGEIIPKGIIERPPSAELRPDQKDSDTLPPYEIVDNVLCDYVEEHIPPKEIAEKHGYPLKVVLELIKRIHANEYKRRQAAPGLRISEKAFSVGYRFPIVQRWI